VIVNGNFNNLRDFAVDGTSSLVVSGDFFVDENTMEIGVGIHLEGRFG
jgi:hypothetical protein